MLFLAWVPEPVDPKVPAFLESNEIPAFKAALFLWEIFYAAPARRNVAAAYLLAEIFVVIAE